MKSSVQSEQNVGAQDGVENALRLSDERLRLAMDAAGHGYWDWDFDTSVAYFSPRYYTMLGYEPGEFPPCLQSWADLLHPDDRPALLERVQGDLHTAFNFDGEFRLRCKDGSWKWISCRSKGYDLDADGIPHRAVGIHIDIHDRKRAETVISESERMYRILFEHSPDACVILQLDSIIDCNQAFEVMFLCKRLQVIGKSPMIFCPELQLDGRKSVEVAAEKINAALHSGRQRFEFIHRRFDGTDFGTDVTLSSIMLKGHHAVFGSLRDITERKKNEAELLETNRLLEDAIERTNEMAVRAEIGTITKTRFLANMSHEIRTPLNAILGFAQLLRSDPAATEAQIQRLDVINSSGKHLLALLNDILELSKIESGHQTLTQTTFNLQTMLGDLMMVFRHKAEDKMLSLSTEIVDPSPRHVVADELKLRQILINLLGNAVKFTAAGRVWLRVESKPDADCGLRLAIQVGDTGPGIAANDIERLFEPFEQGSAQHSVGGTGLGLTISRQFARLMGGDLTVDSTLGNGTVFTLEIPVKAGEGEPAASKKVDFKIPRLASDHPQCRVLVADDDPSSRALLVELLGCAGFELRDAMNGSKAIEVFNSWRPHLILMDVNMPGMSGFDAVQHIRGRPDGGKADVKIIFITAMATDDFRCQALNAGANGFITKPFRQEELFDSIRLATGVRYAEEQQTTQLADVTTQLLTPEILGRLPKEVRLQLYDAVISGRQSQLSKLIQQIDSVDAEAAAGIRRLAMAFDYEKLLKLLA